MTTYDYDLIVIGAGSGGTRAARVAAQHGARVAVIEERYLGGTCVNVGCIPKKLFVYASHFSEDFKDAEGFGWNVNKPRFSWNTLVENKNQEINRLNDVYQKLIEKAGADLVWGSARIKDIHSVGVGSEYYSAERILIATGGWPSVPEFPGRQHVITSNEVFYLERLPERVVIVGGGYIAVEFASIFHGLGSEVTQLYRGPMFLRGFDHDVRERMAEEMRHKGVNLLFDVSINSIRQNGDESFLLADLSDGTTLESDEIMYATGRTPKIEHLGLEDVGVMLNDAGAIIIDDRWQTSVPHIYAIGDVTDRIKLTPVAIAEGHTLADNLYGAVGRTLSYHDIPSAIFSLPPIGTVGLTESEARARYKSIDVYKSSFTPLKLALSERGERTMMKLIVDSASDRVVGIHMVGPEAGEIIQGFAVAMCTGATKTQFDATVGIHPTAAEEFVTMREKFA